MNHILPKNFKYPECKNYFLKNSLFFISFSRQKIK
jgi:hypothetical protein